MTDVIEHDVTVETNPVNGSLVVSDIIDDHLVTEVYYGYSEKEAVADFVSKHLEP